MLYIHCVPKKQTPVILSNDCHKSDKMLIIFVHRIINKSTAFTYITVIVRFDKGEYQLKLFPQQPLIICKRDRILGQICSSYLKIS